MKSVCYISCFVFIVFAKIEIFISKPLEILPDGRGSKACSLVASRIKCERFPSVMIFDILKLFNSTNYFGIQK